MQTIMDFFNNEICIQFSSYQDERVDFTENLPDEIILWAVVVDSCNFISS